VLDDAEVRGISVYRSKLSLISILLAGNLTSSSRPPGSCSRLPRQLSPKVSSSSPCHPSATTPPLLNSLRKTLNSEPPSSTM